MSDEQAGATDAKALADLLRQGRLKHERLTSARILACRPNIPGWDKESWNRDYPEVGNRENFIARFVLESGWQAARITALETELHSTVTTEYHDSIVGAANKQIHELEAELAKARNEIARLNGQTISLPDMSVVNELRTQLAEVQHDAKRNKWRLDENAKAHEEHSELLQAQLAEASKTAAEIRAEVMDAIQAQIRLTTENLDGSDDWKAGVWALHSRVWHIIGAIRFADRKATS